VRKLRVKFDKKFMMGWNKKREVMGYYDRLAPVYDDQYAEEQKTKIRAALNYVNLKEESLVLDVGCGTGFLFEHFGDFVKLFVGLDISSGILKEAKKRAKRFPKATLIRADADFLPFPDGVFDGVFALTLLQNMPNPLLTLHEMKRVSRYRSTLVITGFKKFQIYRYFYQSTFSRLLKEAGLKASIIMRNDRLKDYVAVCKLESPFS